MKILFFIYLTSEKRGKFREEFFISKKLMKINDEISIPQIIFDDILAINYEQFEILQEANLLDKISLGKICCHFRFFNKRLVYPNFESNNFLTNEGEEFFLNFQDLQDKIKNCIYCNSRKRLRKKVKFFCNFRNSFDEDINEILSFCEENEISISLYDSVNLINFLNGKEDSEFYYLYNYKNENILMINDQIIPIEEFSEYKNTLLNIEKGLICFLCNGLIIFDKNENDINYDNYQDNIIKIRNNNNEYKIINKDALRKCKNCKEKSEKNNNYNSNNFSNIDNIKSNMENSKINIDKIITKLNNKENKIDNYNFINKLEIRKYN
jgi:hypothetical protein